MPRRKDIVTEMTTEEYETMVDTATGPVAPGQLQLDGTPADHENPEANGTLKRITRSKNPRAVLLGKIRSILLEVMKENQVSEVRSIAFDPQNATELLIRVDDEDVVQITNAKEFLEFVKEAPPSLFGLE